MESIIPSGNKSQKQSGEWTAFILHFRHISSVLTEQHGKLKFRLIPE